jgi:hypothetical protein
MSATRKNRSDEDEETFDLIEDIEEIKKNDTEQKDPYTRIEFDKSRILYNKIKRLLEMETPTEPSKFVRESIQKMSDLLKSGYASNKDEIEKLCIALFTLCSNTRIPPSEHAGNFYSFKEKVSILCKEILYLNYYQTLCFNIVEITKTVKDESNSKSLNSLKQECHALYESYLLEIFSEKIAYEKLIDITTSYKELIKKKKEKASLFSYSNNTLWNTNNAIVTKLEKIISNAKSLEPLKTRQNLTGSQLSH